MKHFLALSKHDLTLSKAEALALYKTDEYELIGNLLVIDSNDKFYKMLAYTKEAYRFLFKASSDEIFDKIRKYDWEKCYDTSFSVRVVNDNKSERKIAGEIFGKLKKPKVDLKNAKTKIVFFKFEKETVCGKLIYTQEKAFNLRKAHLRPELHPTSLSPQLAIACINLTGKTKGKLLDPFCGSGGILIEAGLLGFNVSGYDIDRIMINRAKINLEHFRIRKFNLTLQDATKSKDKCDCIVTDLPYGKSSKLSSEIKTLYRDFLKNAYNQTNTAVVLFPDFVDYTEFLGDWKEKASFDYYLHKSLSKKVVVLRK